MCSPAFPTTGFFPLYFHYGTICLETPDSLRGVVVDQWIRQNHMEKFDNVTIGVPGLYMFYVKIAYNCKHSSTDKVGDGYVTKLVANQYV